MSGAPGSAGASGAAASTHSPAPPLPAAAVVAGGALLAAVVLPSAAVCYTGGSVHELAQRSRVIVEGKVQHGAEARRRKQPAEQGNASVTPGRRKAAQLDGYTDTATAVSSAALATAAAATDWIAATTSTPLHTYLVKVHQVWPVKSAGLDKDSVITVHGDFGSSCGRLKEDSRYIFFMDPTNTSSIFRASYPPLETGRSLKKDVGRVLCRGCGKSTHPSSNASASHGTLGKV